MHWMFLIVIPFYDKYCGRPEICVWVFGQLGTRLLALVYLGDKTKVGTILLAFAWTLISN